jgi:hypothetical protein
MHNRLLQWTLSDTYRDDHTSPDAHTHPDAHAARDRSSDGRR